MSLTFLFDGLLVVLLATTIVYAAILNRRLRLLRQSEGEMKALLQEFNSSATKAEASLGQMKALAGQAQSEAARGAPESREAAVELAALKQLLERGQTLKDDLTFLIDRGESVADRLVAIVSEARAATRPGAAVGTAIRDERAIDLSAVPLKPVAAAGTGPKARKAAGGSSAAERELLKALRAARPER